MRHGIQKIEVSENTHLNRCLFTRGMVQGHCHVSCVTFHSPVTLYPWSFEHYIRGPWFLRFSFLDVFIER